MPKAAKKNEDGIRKGKAAKSGLNRSLLRNARFQLRTRTTQKVEARGGTCVAIDPKFTSQHCSCCKSVDKRNRKSQAKFHCLNCGYKKNADFNAARNILQRGLAA